MDAPREGPRVDVERPRCPYCHDDVGPDDAKTACEGCMAWHHRACWEEHRTCATCGQTATATPPVVVVAEPPTAPCQRLGCSAHAEPGRPVCTRHANQDSRVGLAIGLVALIVGAIIFVVTDGLATLGAAIMVLGALNLGLAAKTASDRHFAARPPRPSRAKD